MATLAFAAAGAALAPAGYAAVGWTIGSIVGQSLFPGRLPDRQGPQLSDTRAPGLEYGSPIARAWGVISLAGAPIWMSDIIETANVQRSGGKGGPSQTTTTYSYRVSMAVKFCRKPKTGDALLRRLWLNKKLVYNVDENANLATVAASNRIAPGIAFYGGGALQSPDPTMEAYLGVGKVPANRDDVTLVLTDLQLAPYGNSPPQVEAEIVMGGTIGQDLLFGTLQGTPVYSGIATDGNIFVCVARTSPGGVARSADGINWTPILPIVPAVTNLTCIAFGDGRWVIGTTTTLVYYSSDALIWSSATIPHSFERVRWLNGQWIGTSPASANGVRSRNGELWAAVTFPVSKTWKDIGDDGSRFVILASDGTLLFTSDAVTFDVGAIGFGANWGRIHSNGSRMVAVRESGAGAAYSDDGGATWTATTLTAQTWLALTWDGQQFVAAGAGNAVAVGDGSTWSEFTFPGAFSGGFYDFAQVGGILVAGPSSAGAGGYSGVFRLDIVIPGTVTVGDVIEELCLDAGLDPSEIDAAAMTQVIDGYAIGRQLDARNAIEPLLQGYYADGVESAGELRFLPRGGAPVMTIDADDLGAHVAGDTPSEPLSLTRQQESELPDSVTVSYFERAMGYEPGLQRDFRQVVRTRLERRVDLPIVMEPDQARDLASVLLYDAWTQRTRYAIQLPAQYCTLQPADVIDIPHDGYTHRMRIERIVESPARVLLMEGAAEEAALYTQSRTGGAGQVAVDTVAAAPTTVFAPLDIPLMRDQDDTVGIYAAARGAADGWGGSVIYRSLDGGGSYDDIGAITSAAAIGYASTVLPTHVGDAFDNASTVTVTLFGGTLSSVSNDLIKAGSNTAVLGGEIFQFRDAQLIAVNTYRLSGLSRGLRGTGWAVATHTAGERFVLLNASTLTRFLAELNESRRYKPVSIGRTLQETAFQDFTYTGVSLKPLPPANLAGGRLANNDFIATWNRRSRTGISLPLFFVPPIGEQLERYDVEIYTSNFVTLRRTFSALTTPTVTYTAAQQASDGGVQAAYGVRVYQISQTLNARGYVLQGIR